MDEMNWLCIFFVLKDFVPVVSLSRHLFSVPSILDSLPSKHE